MDVVEVEVFVVAVDCFFVVAAVAGVVQVVALVPVLEAVVPACSHPIRRGVNQFSLREVAVLQFQRHECLLHHNGHCFAVYLL